jgi:hypothetical protein
MFEPVIQANDSLVLNGDFREVWSSGTRATMDVRFSHRRSV